MEHFTPIASLIGGALIGASAALLLLGNGRIAGISGIDRSIREASVALGMTTRDLLWRVELPLAMPSIVAGVKTAAVIDIGTATIGALIGAGGYGQPILTGIRLDDFGLLLQGALPAAAMAVAAERFFEAVERRVVPRGLRRRDAQ